MQEHREVASDRLETRRQHRFRRSADDDVIAVLDRPAEQAIAHRTSHKIGVHRRHSRMLPVLPHIPFTRSPSSSDLHSRRPCHAAPAHSILPASARPVGTAARGRRRDDCRPPAGLVTIEGAGGGGLVPWAVMAGLSTRPGHDAVLGVSTTRVGDFRLDSIGPVGLVERPLRTLARTPAVHGRSRAVAGRHRPPASARPCFGAKLRVAGDLIYGSDLPQMAVGLQYKHSDSDVLASALGARRNDDVEAYFSVTRLFLAGPFDRNWLLNGTLRATRANETGLLGFGRADDNGYDLVGEVSAAMFFNPEVALGAEYRQKPDGLPGLGESDWRDVFVAWVPNRASAWPWPGSISARLPRARTRMACSCR
jgi:hypothetical protein